MTIIIIIIIDCRVAWQPCRMGDLDPGHAIVPSFVWLCRLFRVAILSSGDDSNEWHKSFGFCSKYHLLHLSHLSSQRIHECLKIGTIDILIQSRPQHRHKIIFFVVSLLVMSCNVFLSRFLIVANTRICCSVYYYFCVTYFFSCDVFLKQTLIKWFNVRLH